MGAYNVDAVCGWRWRRPELSTALRRCGRGVGVGREDEGGGGSLPLGGRGHPVAPDTRLRGRASPGVGAGRGVGVSSCTWAAGVGFT